ncbi:MAG: glutamate--tRNA ligase family protein [Bacteroidales bacterium]|nr:glutamate--tRNA ligase family protein [Bacteroidales bacterium]
MNAEILTHNESARGRFAPSPTGRMHLGNVWSALLSWLSVKSKGGQWILRHEDLDPERSRIDFIEQIEDDLNWLGLTWDEGGLNNKGDYGPYVQSERTEWYNAALSTLQEHLYPCRCTRAERLAVSAPHTSDLRPTHCGCYQQFIAHSFKIDKYRKPITKLHLQTNEPLDAYIDGHYGIIENKPLVDPIVRRSDGAFAYNLAVVVDDAAMHITEVVRGNDLLSSTPLQMCIHHMLHQNAPTTFHHPLLCATDGRRLCKRDGDMHMGALQQHYSAQQIIGILAHAANLIPKPEPIAPTDLIPLFDWSKIPHNNIILKL